MVWAAVAIGGASLVAGLAGARDQRNAQNQALSQAQRAELGTALVSGSGGAQAFSSSEGDVGFSIGNLIPAQQQFANVAEFGGRAAQHALVGGVPSGVLNAARGLDNQNLDLGTFLRGGIGSEALAGLSLRQAFDPSRTSAQVSERALGQLRAQAAPQEEQALRSFQQGLFGSGRGAVTGAVGNESSIGGGRLAAAFAQGLGRADLDRQLTAQDFGIRAAQAEEGLLSSAFSRFGSTAQLAGDFNQLGFGRTRQSLQDRLSRETAFTTLPANIASAFQGVASGGAGNAVQLGNFGINLAQLGLQQNTARSNAAAGVASNVGSIVTAPTFSANPVADAFGALTAPAVPAAVAGLGQRFPNAPIVGSNKIQPTFTGAP